MKKVIAIFLAIVMTIALIPSMVGYTDKENASVSVGEWLSLIDSEFGMSYYEQTEPYFADITADNIYFTAVQAAVEWNVISINDSIDVFAAVKTDFMAATLVMAAKLDSGAVTVKNADKLFNPDAVAIAAGNGIVTLEKDGKLKVSSITLAQGKAALATAKNLWATKSFSDDKANVTVADSVVDLTELLADANEASFVIAASESGNEVLTLPATPETASLVSGDVVILPATAENPFGSAKKIDAAASADNGVVTVECSDAEIGDVFDDINLETDFAPDFLTGQITDESGNVVNSADASAAQGFSLTDSGIATAADQNVMLSLLKDTSSADVQQCADLSKNPVDINFSAGGYSVAGKIDGDKMDFSVSGTINGVKITKTYNFSNFNLSTKADISVARAKIKEAYIRVDYDVVDSTKVEGNYNTALADYNLTKEATLSDVDNALGTNMLASLQGAADKVAASVNNTFKIASVEIPIPNMPVVTIALDISLRVNIDGSIELVVETNNARGYEIIDNQGRVINNTVNKQNTVNLGADCQLTANFGIALKLIGLTVVDAGVETGIGVDANASITWFTAKAEPADTVTADIPLEVALTLTAGDTYCNVTGDIVVYGILTVSVGENSPILKAVGLSKTWSIFNKDNAVIYSYHFDEGNIPEAQTAVEEAPADVITASAPEAVTAAVSPAASVSLKAGETLSLADKGTAWASSNSSVAVVAADGTVTAVSAGTAVITGTASDGATVSYQITVIESEVTNADVVVVSAYRFAPIGYSL